MKRSGFTLIELSIVLVIIGLIIGGVMKGRDLINSATQKKIYNTWVNQWKLTANMYEDRTGSILADATANGGTASSEDGKMDNINLSSTKTVQDKLDAIGLDIPVSNISTSDNTGKGGSYLMKGKYSTSKTSMTLLYESGHDGDSNAIYIYHVPTDMAIAFDKMADGTLDAAHGNFGNYDDKTTTTWPDAKTTATVNVYLKVN